MEQQFMNDLYKQIAKQLNIKTSQINAVLKLLEEGATVPFIARYRKEVTGALDEEQIREISKTYEYGVERIAAALNEVLTPETKPIICLETMAGKGKEIGRSFEELRDIIDRIELKDKIGVCFDTCHVHDSGYDIVENLDEVFAEFDRIIGLDRLKVFHINGSLNPRGAKKDRHANLGATEDNPKGKDYIGKEALYRLVHHPAAQGKPVILETPWLDKKTNLYKEEIAYLRGDE